MATVTRRDRFADLAALILIAAGTALFLRSLLRLQEISRLTYAHPGPRGSSALHAADLARYGSNAGAGLIIAGVVVAVVSALRHRRRGGSSAVS